MTTTDRSTSASTEWMLQGGGEAAALIRAIDWATTPLGPMADWPQSLKTTVSTMLHSRHPMFLWWSPELIQFYNDAYAPSFGRGKHPRAMGQPGKECWPEIWPIIGPQIADVMERGIPSWHEDALVPIFRNGAIEDVYWTYGYSPVFDDQGDVGGTLVICTETTPRVIATERENELRAEQDRDRARLQQFFAQAPAGICILRGASLTFEFANDHYRRIVGGRDVVGKPMLEALPELKDRGLDTILHRVIESGEPYVGVEVPVLLDRGGTGVPENTFYTFVYSPLREAASPVDAAIVLALDVTTEVAAKRESESLALRLRESEAQFHQLAESIPQLAWTTRADGHIDWYNRRWYDYTGTTAESMTGWGWTSVHDPARVGEVVEQWSASLATGKPFEMEFALRGKDGILRWFLTRAAPIHGKDGDIVRWFGTNTDIDASRRDALERATLLENERRARAAAELASRAKDDFLATASHELRTPLNAIMGWARLLQTGQLNPAAVIQAIDVIERNGRAQVRLIEDILDGSRIITGKLHLETRPLDMTVVLKAALDSVQASVDAKRIALAVEVDAEAARVIGDPERLQQVIWNLVNNAVKFTPKDGAVTVALKRAGTDIELRVSDNGQGIEAEFLPHVFERFRQAEESTTRRYGGLGLGLALVRHLVEAHGGTVRAESGGAGQGATFTVTLPVQAVYAATPAAVSPDHESTRTFVPRPTGLSGVTVLVVDDEADARDLVATALRGKGADVTTAASAAEALDLMVQRSFTVMVSDVGMPDTDGYELIRRVRKLGTDRAAVQAVALTAYSREEDRRRALEAGFQTYLSKPVDPDELVKVVASLAMTVESQIHQTSSGIMARAQTLAKFEKELGANGVQEALRFLNNRTAHRFTGVYRFDPPTLHNLALLDAKDRAVAQGENPPMEATYCSIVGTFERPFTSEDTLQDERLRAHPARESVRSYCGVLLRREDGTPFGTLCHFDLVPRDVPVAELALMEAAAPLLMKAIAARAEDSK
ncbi:MAG: ATP-binding protein [Vicinamibacteria bacterium]